MFAFINDLCESKLIPSQNSLKRWETKKLAELTYLYFLGLRVLLGHEKTRKWAEDYCHKTGNPNDFLKWRSSGNDLYVLLHALSVDDDDDDKVKVSRDIHITPGIIRTWLRHADGKDRGLFQRLDGMLHITNASFKSLRRIVSEWDDTKAPEQQDTLTKLTQFIHTRASSNSEILPELKKLAKVDEAATMGGTSVASVATVPGGLGSGFAPDDDWRSIYSKKKTKKPVVLHR